MTTRLCHVHSQLLQHMTNSSMQNTNLIVVTHGNLQQKDTPQELMTGKNSKGNSTEQSSTSTFLRALGSMYPSLARLRLVNSKLWKDPLRLSLLSPEMKANILSLLNRSSKSGKMVTMKKWYESLKKKNPTF